MDEKRLEREFVHSVLDMYRHTPGTTGTVRHLDRMIALQLYQRGISTTVVENALLLAAARRLMRPPDAPPLGTIRSLAYFLPVIEEVLQVPVEATYFRHLRAKLDRFLALQRLTSSAR
jgi:hypothetical protein